ncbi:hypothetical protein EBB07_02970 [Paenibacillaceae bacterium]|nr:hypothetical protein EBB07_02970 [Paenibacillaceae bacterium]
MAKVIIEQVQLGQWGRCVKMSNGLVELAATLDFGPRIIHCSTAGGSNLFFEDKEDKAKQGGDHFKPVGGGDWHMYGGHRLWTSPERVPRTTYPDNEPVQWEQLGEDTIILRSATEQWNQVRKEIEIRLEADSADVQVTHRITNEGPWPVSFAVWALSVMGAGGKAYVPQISPDTALLPNRVLSLWPYTRMNDKRVVWGDRLITVNQEQDAHPFKFGLTNDAGWTAYAHHGDVFLKFYKPVAGGTYPDYGVNFELYTNDLFLELETLGEYRQVESGETAAHQETWRLVQGLDLAAADEDEVLNLLAPHLL